MRGFQQRLVDNLYHTHGQAVQTASLHDAYMALCYTIRDQLIERWRRTTEAQFEANPRFVYYLSAEYLLGRQLGNALLATGMTEVAREALAGLDLDLDSIAELEIEPGLGNGGLGRLAACFADSLATLGRPAIGGDHRFMPNSEFTRTC